MDNKENLNAIAEALKNFNTFSIYSHINTDFDALCSSLVLKRVLEKMGKTAHVFSHSGFPSNITILDGYEKINNESLKTYDVAIILDSGDEKRIGKYFYKYKKGTKTTISIDHHVGTPVYTKLHYLNEKASSTCELLYELFNVMNVELDSVSCRLLLSGIYTDTGALKQSNTSAKTMRICSDLFEKTKMPMDEIMVPIFKSMTLSAFNLKKFVFNNLELHSDGKLAICVLTADDIVSAGASFTDTEGLVDIGTDIQSVLIDALLSEDPNERGAFRVSIRSKGDYSARNIAMAFGGGGHLKASGCKIYDSGENAKKKLLAEMEKELKRL